MAAQLQISAEEAAMNGAPEGVLYVAKILERDEVPIPSDAASSLDEILQQLQTKTALSEWWEQFTFADKIRGVVVHNGEIVTSKAAKELVPELCTIGGSSRSALAHQALVTLGDLMHFCPKAMSGCGGSALGHLADLFFDSAKKNKARVLRDRAATVLDEVTDSRGSGGGGYGGGDDVDAAAAAAGSDDSGGDDEAMTQLVVELLAPSLSKKHVAHLDLKVMERAMLFAEHACERFADRGMLQSPPPGGSGVGGDCGVVLEGKPLAALLGGLGGGCLSKSADAKSAAKRGVCVLAAALTTVEGSGGGGGGIASSSFKALVQGAGVSPSSAVAELLKVPLKPSKELPGLALSRRTQAREEVVKAAVAAREEAKAAAEKARAEGGGEEEEEGQLLPPPPVKPSRDFARDPKPPKKEGVGGHKAAAAVPKEQSTAAAEEEGDAAALSISSLHSSSDFTAPPATAADDDANDDDNGGSSSSSSSSSGSGSNASGVTVNPLLQPRSVWCMLSAHLHATKGRASELFSAMDKDRSRKVTKQEMGSFLTSLGLQHELQDLEEAFASAGGAVPSNGGGGGGSSSSSSRASSGSGSSGGGGGLTLTQVKSEVARHTRELNANPDALARHLENLKLGRSSSSSNNNARFPSARSSSSASSSSSTPNSARRTNNKTPPRTRSPPRSSNTTTPTAASNTRTPKASSSSSSSSSSKPTTPSVKSALKSSSPRSTSSSSSSSSPSFFSSSSSTTAATRNHSLTSNSTISSKATAMDELVEMAVDEISLSGGCGGGLGEGGFMGSGQQKASGVVLGFDKAGSKVAAKLHGTLCDMGVEVKPLMKGESRPYLEEHQLEISGCALLVVLKTSTYGREPKHQAEVGALTAATNNTTSPPAAPTTPFLVVDLCPHPTTSAAGATPAVLDKLLAGSAAVPEKCVYRPPMSWDPDEALSEGRLPVDLSAHVVNFMIASASSTASYNTDDSKKYAATSSAVPRRASLVLMGMMGGGDDDDDQKGAEGGDEEQEGENEGDVAESEAAFLRFQKQQRGV